ncbi:MAG: hypothetical protein WC670_18365, partial [Pseudolabrys sp.]
RAEDVSMGGMNRAMRRRMVARQGIGWRAHRKLERERRSEAKVAAAALKLTPAQADKAIAEFEKLARTDAGEG